MASIIHAVMLLCCVLQETPATDVQDPDYASLLERARAEYWLGHFAQSEALFVKTLRMLPRNDQGRLAGILSELGDVYVNEDQLPQAERTYAESLAIYRGSGDKHHAALLLRNLGAVYSLQRREDDAVRALEQSLKTARAAPRADAAFISQVLNSLGVEYFRQGKNGKAEKFFNQAAQSVAGQDGISGRADLLNNLGAVYLAKRQYRKAEEYLKQALKVTEGIVGAEHPDLTFSLSTLGTVYAESGNYVEAEKQYQRAIDILSPGSAQFDTRIARLLQALSETYIKAGRTADADDTLFRASVIARQNVSSHPDMIRIMDAYAERLHKLGRKQESEDVRLEARRARAAASMVIRAHNSFD